MSNITGASQPGVFVDTNALVFLRAYLEAAKKHRCVPYGSQTSWDDIGHLLKEKGLFSQQREHLKKGLGTLAFLQQKAEAGYQIFVSRISLAEILHGGLEGRAHFKMTEAGLTYRMRQRSSDLSELVCFWLSSDDYNRIRADTDSLLSDVEALIETKISLTGHGRSIRDLLALMEIVLGNVYFDVIDSWLYAEALTEQTQKLLTFDRYFRDTINSIYDQRDASDDERREMWLQAKAALIQATCAILMVSLEDQQAINVPEAPTWNQVKQLIDPFLTKIKA